MRRLLSQTRQNNGVCNKLGSGCGTVDRVVASDTRGPGFKSSHRHFLLNNLLLTLCRKDENIVQNYSSTIFNN